MFDSVQQCPPVAAQVEIVEAEGALTLRNRVPLKSCWNSVPAVLAHWAEATPSALFLCERDDHGSWRGKSYAEVESSVWSLAGKVLALGCSSERPLATLAPNSILHAELLLAAQLVGVPVCPISLGYATSTASFERLRTMISTITPAAVFFHDPVASAPAITALSELAPAIASEEHDGVRALSSICALNAAVVAKATQRIGPASIAKLLFTSGSTGKPKAVVNTQQMLCANQAMLQQVWPVLEQRPPILVDWLPWGHTFGANFTFGIALFNGGTLYIDAGKPVAGLFETSLANLAEIQPTLYFNVPVGFDMLLAALENDTGLAQRILARLDFLFCAAAALPQGTRERVASLVRKVRGRDIPQYSGWGCTETAPCATATWFDTSFAADIGVPLPGTEVRLAPYGDRLELRVRGPIVMPSYWGDPEATAAAFDENGFYKTGDAGKLLDPAQPERGLMFDGRVSENFKLSTGTWVSVGALRLEIVDRGRPYVRDLVIAGHDRDELGALIFLNRDPCRELAGRDDLKVADLARHPLVRDHIRGIIAHHNEGRGSSARIARVAIIEDDPSPERYEITDKGYMNQAAVLTARAQLVAALFESDEYRVQAASRTGGGRINV